MDLVAHQYVEDLVSGHRVLDLDLRDGLPKSRNSYRLLDGETKQPHGLAEVWIVGRDWLYRANRLNGRTLKDRPTVQVREAKIQKNLSQFRAQGLACFQDAQVQPPLPRSQVEPGNAALSTPIGCYSGHKY